MPEQNEKLQQQIDQAACGPSAGLPLELGEEVHGIEILGQDGSLVGVLRLNKEWCGSELPKNMARNFIRRVNLHDRLAETLRDLIPEARDAMRQVNEVCTCDAYDIEAVLKPSLDLLAEAEAQ